MRGKKYYEKLYMQPVRICINRKCKYLGEAETGIKGCIRAGRQFNGKIMCPEMVVA